MKQMYEMLTLGKEGCNRQHTRFYIKPIQVGYGGENSAHGVENVRGSNSRGR